MRASELRPNPKNPRTITDKKLAMLKASLGEFGDLGAIVYNRKSKQLVGGHQRVKLLPEDASVTIETKYPKPTKTGTVAEGYVTFGGERFKYREVSWSESKEKAANIAANKGAGEWDMAQLGDWMRELGDFDSDLDLDLTMFDEKERAQFELTDSSSDVEEDDLPAVPKVPKTKLGDVYQLGKHRLRCGDSTNPADVSALLKGETFALCFTSPPYADQRQYNGDKDLSTEHLATFIRASASVGGTFAVNLGYSRKDMEVNPYWDDYISEARAAGLKLLSWNVWDKGEVSSIGNQTAMFAISHEWIFIFGKEVRKLNKTVPNKLAGQLSGTGTRGADGKVKGHKASVINTHSHLKTILQCSPVKGSVNGIDHPAMFPVTLPLAYIEAMTDAGEVVYEPFGGSGSTLIACEKLGRVAAVMELDPGYCDVIVARWEQFTGKTATLATQGKAQGKRRG